MLHVYDIIFMRFMLTTFPPHYCCLSFSGVTWQTLLYVCCGCEYVALATSLPTLPPPLVPALCPLCCLLAKLCHLRQILMLHTRLIEKIVAVNETTRERELGGYS